MRPVRHPRRRTPPRRSDSKSSSPDPELVRFLHEQKRPNSPESEAFRNKRIAAGGVFNVKSRHQREKEEAEKKKIEEEENAAKAYQEFVQDMLGGDDGDGNEARNNFVRAGNSSSSYQPSTSRHQSGRQFGDFPSTSKAMREEGIISSHKLMVMEDDDQDEASLKREIPGKRKGAMGSFLGELQRDQAQREERLRSRVSEGNSISTLLAQEAGGSSKPWDSSDPASSNICVLNLPPNVTEYIFGEYFSRYGDVASVKIMWPRSADDAIASNVRSTKTSGATGFVNFMKRRDAERAYKEIEGSEWMGNLLRTGWGKALMKPLYPIHSQPASSSSSSSRHQIEGHQKETSRLDRQARSSRSPTLRNHRRIRKQSPDAMTLLQRAVREQNGEEMLKRIITMGTNVRQYGKTFEGMVKTKHAGDPRYNFLLTKGTMESTLFRALAEEDYEINLPAPTFQDDGEASLYSSDSEEDSEWETLRLQERTKFLGKAARRRLEAMLRGITLRRERIARIMLFAIDHAVAAETVSKIIIDSILQPTTPISRKLARLYVVSDILHNSSVSASNAWRYRSLFEDYLDKVFLHWGDVSNSFAGRIKRESCKEMARNILNIWENWLVYESAKLIAWRQSIESGSMSINTRDALEEDEMKSWIRN